MDIDIYHMHNGRDMCNYDDGLKDAQSCLYFTQPSEEIDL